MASTYHKRILARTRRVHEFRDFAVANREQLLSFDRVVRIGIGYRQRSGVFRGALAVRLHIDGPKLLPTSRNSRNLAPATLHGVPLDVVSYQEKIGSDCGKMPDPFRIARVDPLIGGISIGHLDAATLGVVLPSEKYGVIALTAQHAVDGSDEMWQPSPLEETGSERRIGTVADYLSARDAAIVHITESASIGEIEGLPSIRGVATAEEIVELKARETVLAKSGRSTGVTWGRIVGIGDLGDITIAPRKGRETEELSCRGDSGAIWMTRNGIGVALHSRGEKQDRQEVAVAWILSPIVKHWGLRGSIT